MKYSSSTQSTDWYRVTWAVTREVAPEEWRDVLAIPGVRYYPRALEIPRTAWGMPQIIDLCNGIGVAPPTHVSKYASVGLWQPFQRPLSHQPFVAQLLLSQHRVLLADQLGLGKTRSAIQAAETVRRHVYNGSRPVVVIGPLRTRAVWKKELLETGAIETLSEFCALRTRDFHDRCWNEDAAYFFVHYDIVDAWWSKFQALRPCVAIVDEAHYVKSIASRRARNAAMIVQPSPFRLLLTGTPIDNEPKDLYSLLDLLNGSQTWGSRTDFRVRYCGARRETYGYTDTEPTNVAELRSRMFPYFVRREVSDVEIELPPFARELVEVETPVGKERSYQQHTRLLSQGQIHALVETIASGGMLGRDAIRTLGELRKLTSDAKLGATVELASDILAADGAVVVFTWQRSTATYLQQTLQPSRKAITGEIPIEARDALVEGFQRAGGVLVATYGALQDAVTLHRARAMICHDIDYLPRVMLQAEKRIHRIGQSRGCKVYWMVATKLFDRILLTALRRKSADTELILELSEQLPELLGETDDHDVFTAQMEQSIREWRQWSI